MGKQKDHSMHAMTVHNERIIHKGQPEIKHYCDKCMQTYQTKDGQHYKVEAAVTDGLTMCHPCCSMFACPLTLTSNHHHFCAPHSHLHLVCAVVGCNNTVVKCSKTVNRKVITTNMKMCSDPLHQEMEANF